MEYNLDLIAERSLVRESLKGIIWTIFFHRLFGPIEPTTNEFLDVTYPMANNLPDLDSKIDERINQLIKTEFNNANIDANGNVIIQFFDKNVKSKKSGWFSQGKRADLLLWESWVIDVKCLAISNQKSAEDSGVLASNIKLSTKSFEDNISKIGEIVDTHKSHIPPITSLDSSPFPHEIYINKKEADMNYTTSKEEEGWGKYIKKMLD